MDNLELALQNLKDELDKTEIIQEYLKLKNTFESDSQLAELRTEIAKLANEGKKEEHDSLLKIYNSHPVVTNYEQAIEEVIALLKEIKEILSD